MSTSHINQLQQQIQVLTDQINDIFHASELNFSAIKIHLQLNNPNQSHHPNIIHQCQNQFNKLRQSYTTRSNLRLQYLINQQIKLQQQKVRRQRLLEYEDKIYDHRRLVCDKQAFYDSLIKPKYRKPVGMTIEQFQQERQREIQFEEKRNHQQLEEETQMLIKIEKMVRNFRVGLEEEYQKYREQVEKLDEINKKKNKNKNKQISNQHQHQQQQLSQQESLQQQYQQQPQLQDEQNPTPIPQQFQQQNNIFSSLTTKLAIYETVDISNKSSLFLSLQSLNQSHKIFHQLFTIQQSTQQLLKKYKQQRQMYKYLRWEQKQLIEKYKKIEKDIKKIKDDGQVKNNNKEGEFMRSK